MEEMILEPEQLQLIPVERALPMVAPKKKGPGADQEEKEPGGQRSAGSPGSVAAAECGPGGDYICAAGRADIKKSAHMSRQARAPW